MISEHNGVVAWGKSGKVLNIHIDQNTTVDTVKDFAMSELGRTDEHDRKKLVLLDHLGNQPRGNDLVCNYRHLFLFIRPSRDQPLNHPDIADFSSISRHLEDIHVPEVSIPARFRHPPVSSAAAQRLTKVHEELYTRTERCRAFAQAAQERADFCRESVQAQQMQNHGRDAVCAQLSQLGAKVSEAFMELRQRVLTEGSQFNDLLETYETDVRRLRTTELHPSMKSESKVVLSDWIPDTTQWKNKCYELWQALHIKMTEHEKELEQVQREVETINNTLPDSVNFEELEQAVNETQMTAGNLRNFLEELESNLMNVTDQLAGFSVPDEHNRDEAKWKEWLDAQAAAEGQLVLDYSSMSKWCRVCHASRAALQNFLIKHVERAVGVSSTVMKLQRRIHACMALFTGLGEYFFQLRIVRHLPEAYKWGLIELLRRMHYHKILAHKLTSVQQSFDHLHEEESRKRRLYERQYGRYLPEGMLHWLKQQTLHAKVDTHPPASDCTYPDLAPPHDTPERIKDLFANLPIPFGDGLDAPPACLDMLHSEAMAAELEALSAEVEAGSKERSSMEGSLLARQLQASHDRLAQIEEQLRQSKAQEEELRQQLAEKEARSSDMSKRLEVREANYEAQEDLKARLAEKEAQIAEMAKKLEARDERHEEQVTRLTKQLEELQLLPRSSSGRLPEEIENLSKDALILSVKELNTSHEDILAKNQELERRNEELSEIIGSLTEHDELWPAFGLGKDPETWPRRYTVCTLRNGEKYVSVLHDDEAEHGEVVLVMPNVEDIEKRFERLPGWVVVQVVSTEPYERDRRSIGITAEIVFPR